MRTIHQGTKTHRVLSEFFIGRKIHRFEAEIFGEHSLHSTVSSLERTGLRFDRKTIGVPTRWGADAHVALYWLAADSYPLAAALLGLAVHQNRPQGDAARDYLHASTGSRG